jgi:plastocyanin
MRRSIGALVALACISIGCSNETAVAEGDAAAAAPAAAPSIPAQSTVNGKAPVSAGQPSIVVLQPRNPREFPAQSEKPVMDQIALTFVPAVLVVRAGQPVEFRNSDPELHNIRVREEATKEGTFNVAIPTGQIYQHTLAREGFYDVGCDIHPAMTAMIYASSSPYAALTDAAGNFTIYDVAPGPYTITLYIAGDRIERPVDVTAARTDINLTP